MTTTEQRLADALRALYTLVPFDGNHADEMAKGKQLKEAREALAAYDAQQAQAVSVTTQDVDRVLGMADQFIEDWRESVDDDTARDSELEEREQEWQVIRALILHRVNAHDGLVSALRDIDETCQAGLNSSVYSHWSAALEDSMQAARAALEAAGAQA